MTKVMAEAAVLGEAEAEVKAAALGEAEAAGKAVAMGEAEVTAVAMEEAMVVATKNHPKL